MSVVTGTRHPCDTKEKQSNISKFYRSIAHFLDRVRQPSVEHIGFVKAIRN